MKNKTRLRMGRNNVAIHLTLSAIVALGMLPSARAGTVLRLRSLGTVPFADASNLLFRLPRDQESHIYVLQFRKAITPQDTALLKTHGVETLRYLPDDALIVRARLDDVLLLHTLDPHLRAVNTYRSEWKIDPQLISRSTSRNGKKELLLVSALSNDVSDSVGQMLTGIPDVTISSRWGRDFFVQAPLGRLQQLARIEGVEWIEPAPLLETFILPIGEENGIHRDNDANLPSMTGYENGTKVMNFDAAWKRGFHGEGQIVGVGDTGLDSGNPATIHPDFTETLLHGYAMGLGGTSWADTMGHGTHVSGLIVGTGAASNHQIKGGAYGARLIMEGLWSPILDNLAPGSDFNRLFGKAYDDGARIHSNSWGSATGFGEYDTFASRVDEYMWQHPDMLVLFAAGNNGVDANHDGVIDLASISSPGTAKDVLTVGASENLLTQGGIQRKLSQLRDGDKNWGVEPLKSDTLSNNPNGIACFSSRGPTQDGRLKPEIVAPGTNIVSTRSHQPGASALWGEFNKDYVYAGGTSMATPLTAGAAAVTRQYLIQKMGMDDPSAALVKATLIHTATDLFPGQYGTGAGQEIPKTRPNPVEGYGRVNMDFATRLGQETRLIDDKVGVGVNEQKSYDVNIPSGTTLRATLVYTDAPAAASAAKALVNDIDLKITGPDGRSQETHDQVNNSEMIEIPNASPGKYRVSVVGVNVPEGKNSRQPFALVIGYY